MEQFSPRRTVRKLLQLQLSPNPTHSVVRARTQFYNTLVLVLNGIVDVVNGEKNTLTVTVENKSGKNVTLLSIAGALVHPDTNALLKNVSIVSSAAHRKLIFAAAAVDQPEIWCYSPRGSEASDSLHIPQRVSCLSCFIDLVLTKELQV